MSAPPAGGRLPPGDPLVLRWALGMIRLLVPGDLGWAMGEDLAEEYRTHIRPSRSGRAATLWVLRQTVGSLRHLRALRRGERGQGRGAGRRPGPFERLRQDLSYAARGLRRRRGFTLVALATLALGIGANAAIFSVANGVVFRPLPYSDPGRLVRIAPDQLFPFELESALAFQERATSYEHLAAFGRGLFTFDGVGEPEIVRGARVQANHFAMLGVAPMLGRGFLPEEGLEGGPRVAVLGFGIWQRRYGSDPTIVGRSVEISGVPHTVVGVLRRSHQPIEWDWEVWVPIQIGPTALGAGSGIAMNGRLAAGRTVAEAQAEFRSLYRAYQGERGSGVSPEQLAALRVAPLHDWIVGGASDQLLVLLFAVGFVLLIACANVANLLLASGAAREREMAVRRALGAGSGRIVRQLLTESALLGALGGALGLVIAHLCLAYGVAYLPADLPRAQEIRIDGIVLLFTGCLSVLSAALFGSVPAMRASGSSVADGLRDGSRASLGRRHARLNHGLVGAEVALAVVLVVGAALMLRTVWTLSRVDPGFEPDGVLTLRVSVPPGLDASEGPGYHDRVADAIGAVPGVRSVGAIQFLPMRPGAWWTRFSVPERPVSAGEAPSLAMRVVTPGYFSAMRIPLRAGRGPGPDDRADSDPVIVVNETLAAAAWPDLSDPVGQRLLVGASEPSPFRVIGVVADVRQSDLLTSPHPEGYVPLAQAPWSSLFYAVRTDGDPGSAAAAVRTAVWSVDDRAPISSVAPLKDVVGGTLAGTRFFAGLLAAFGVLALVLGSLGVYGVMSYVVSQRGREIGIRIAMGADSGRVLQSTVMQGMTPVVIGIVVGIAGALVSGRLIGSLLYGVEPHDPTTLFLVSLVLAASAAIALYVPARRASRVDPIRVLRDD